MNRRNGTADRRQVLAGLGAGALSLASGGGVAMAQGKGAPKLVVVGGGFGGASAAMALRRLVPSAEIALIEPNESYTACPFSNLVVAGARDPQAQVFSYDGVRRAGVRVVRDAAADVDPVAREVRLQGGGRLAYDRLVLSPGIDFRWSAIEGYDEAAAGLLPHAWKAGAQTLLLRDQLGAMEDGGLVVMSVPSPPFRCPPGPYERASLIAHYLKTQKPRSKLLILDSQDSFSKQPLFLEAWAQHYGDHLEWRSASEDGRVSRVDPATRTLLTDFEDIRADVANVIPPQKAGWIAERAGVADATGWCPVDPVSFESTLQPGIHVIGDATITAPMPKSAFSANQQAKICAIAIARTLAGRAPSPTLLANTCYSYITPDAAVSISDVYTNAEGAFASVAGAGGLSPLGANLAVRQAEALQAADWLAAITQEAFG